MDTGDGRWTEESEDAALSTAIVDHNLAACRLCLAQKSGGTSNTETGGGVGSGGLLFPLSPPLWARMGAADSPTSTSTHGMGISAGGKDATKGNNKDTSSPFFPAKSSQSQSQSQSQSPGTEKTSTSNHSSSTASAKSGGEGSVAGDDAGEGSSGGGSAGTAAAAAAAVSSNLFKGGTSSMFSGMKMNMGGIFSKGGAGANGPEEVAAATTAGGAAGADADGGASGSGKAGADVAAASGAQPAKADSASDLAAKLRISMSSSFGRFGGSKQVKKGADGGAGGAVAKEAAAPAPAGSSEKEKEKEKDSGFGSLFRKVRLRLTLRLVDVFLSEHLILLEIWKG